MTDAARQEPGIALLEHLLSLSERRPDRTRSASAAPDYDELSSAEMVRRFHTQMEAAERAGAISLRRGRRERRHLIERVSVVDPIALARHLGKTPAGVASSRARAALNPIVVGSDDWVVRLLDEIEGRWARGEAAYRLAPGDVDAAREFLVLAVAIAKDQARGLDARTFSLRVTGDTKALDRHAGRLVGVLAVRFGEPSAKPEQIWTRIGLERFAHPVHIRGPIVVADERGVLVDGRATPFASVHPDLLPMMRLRAQPPALVTIENFASFNRYVREIDDGALVVYTGGFAATGVVELLKSLLATLQPWVPFFHWGDIDPGGLRIFRFLEESLPRPPVPHLMNQDLAIIHGRPARRDPGLGAIADTDSAVATLAAWLARGEDIRHLEQEALDPISPVCGDGKGANLAH